MKHRSDSQSGAKLMAAVGAGILGVACLLVRATSTELVSQGEQFVVTRDFGPVTLDPSAAKDARVFIEPVHMVSAEENAELYPFASGLLRTRVAIVTDKRHSNYFVRFIIQNLVNYSVGNTRGRPSTGYMAATICQSPIKDTVHDCETLTYYYFSNDAKTALFKQLLPLWINSIFPSPAR